MNNTTFYQIYEPLNLEIINILFIIVTIILIIIGIIIIGIICRVFIFCCIVLSFNKMSNNSYGANVSV